MREKAPASYLTKDRRRRARRRRRFFFPDSEDRDLSVGEVSVPMDATNKSYGRFKLSFFKTFWDFPYFYNSGFRKIYVSVLQKKTCVLPVLLFCAKLLAHTDDLAFFLALSLSVSCYIC